MAISTLQPQPKNPLKTIVIYALSSVGVGLLVFMTGMLVKNLLELSGKTSLKVEVLNGDAQVTVNDKSLGNTPVYNETLKPGEAKINIKNALSSYDTSIEFTPNAEVYINRDLGTSKIFSSGQNIWVEKNTTGTVATIISEPSNAYVFIENSEVGRTPYSSNNLSDDSYNIRIEYPGYEPQSAIIKIQKGFTLNLAVKLFPYPVPSTISLMEGATNIYNGSIDNQTITADTQGWLNGLVYWNKTRGLNISGMGSTKEQYFDFYFDYQGNVYDKTGKRLTTKTDLDSLKDAKNSMYLGRTSDGPGLTQSAKESLQAFTQAGVGLQKVTIKSTPTGWLRVRDQASLNGIEIARVDVGGQYEMLEETTGWTKIKVSDTVSGWVSADYITKN